MSDDLTTSDRDTPAGRLPEQPKAGAPIGGDAGAQEGPISERTGRDPANLGDEVPAAGDVTHPAPEPSERSM